MHDVKDWQHAHDYAGDRQRVAERRTHWVIGVTAVVMVIELVAGFATGSMALLADGWHMATHVGALGIAAIAYAVTRRQADNRRFTFGTGKVATLGGYTSAVILGVVAILLAAESFARLVDPQTVHFREAMAVAWIGLAVNLLSAWLLGHAPHPAGHDRDHDHHHAHDDHHAGHAHGALHGDHNLRAAYLHVVADALTSVLAIVALWCGMQFGWVWMDPLMGMVGAAVITRWAYGLLRDSGRVLLDAEDHGDEEREIRALLEADPDVRIADLHLWRVGPQALAGIVSLVAHSPRATEVYKERLARVASLEHLTVEVHRCMPETCPDRLSVS